MNEQYKGHVITIRPLFFGPKDRSSISIDGKPYGIVNTNLASTIAREIVNQKHRIAELKRR